MRHFLPDYFDESKLPKADKELLQNEKALQKMLSSNRMAGGYRMLKDKCVDGWHKVYDTPKMQAGRKVSDRQYQTCIANLVKMGIVKVDPHFHCVYKVK